MQYRFSRGNSILKCYAILMYMLFTMKCYFINTLAFEYSRYYLYLPYNLISLTILQTFRNHDEFIPLISMSLQYIQSSTEIWVDKSSSSIMHQHAAITFKCAFAFTHKCGNNIHRNFSIVKKIRYRTSLPTRPKQTQIIITNRPYDPHYSLPSKSDQLISHPSELSPHATPSSRKL